MKRTDGKEQTSGGYPLPLTGKRLTKESVVTTQAGLPRKEHPEQIVTPQAQKDLLHWTPPPPKMEGPPPELDPKSPGTTPKWVEETILPPSE